MALSKARQFQVISAVTIGGILEWYEFFLYIYWSPIIAELFFQTGSEIVALINTLFIFFIGFLARPIGGLFFGYLGDRFGRKFSFMMTITLMVAPSMLTAFVPTYAQIGVAAPILLGVLRFLQGVPVGGELPGAMCYLYESSYVKERKFTTSFTFFGPQIGVIISLLECFFLERYLSHENLLEWGWRLSFLASGIFGLFGFFLRLKLKETPPFKLLEEEKKVLSNPVAEALKIHKKNIFLGFTASTLEAAGFYIFSVFTGIYFIRLGIISKLDNLIITISILSISSLLILFFGKLGDKIKIKRLFIWSTLALSLISLTLYFFNSHPTKINIIIFELLFMCILSIQTALLPSLFCELFPNRVRYSCIGLSFNLCDSIVGGLTPIVSLYFVQASDNITSFMLVIVVAALVSLTSFCLIKYKET
ncbi:MAG TPA: MFS transporter [Rhabdochlamydiaceae bacterium]|nr:MFS transporter [Rhabdochlamydiaceae bacterium]